MKIFFLFTGNKTLKTEILANNDAKSLSVRVRRNRGDTLYTRRYAERALEEAKNVFEIVSVLIGGEQR